ncbi:oxidoreductase [Entomobacter blattae]|uniref:Putative oxidoreductase YdgJ n=1 Tax=Entomobacter blattae TaxID=2762277 RepID=A0A7H1NQJ1_9PROT|nr:oxidoreductase [Entomobacter blattae]QNT78051.1 putative oxidoreductase YdgJ [Entomobacter blattae]
MPFPVRTALMGYGYAGSTFHAPLLLSTKALSLDLILSSKSQTLSDLFSSMGVKTTSREEDIYQNPEIDLVVIATPNNTHAALCQKALESGKHVVVDKPFTLTGAEARKLTALAKEKELILSVFQNRRWDSDFLTLSQAVKDIDLGTIVEFRSEMSRFRPQVRDRWREHPTPGGGLWYDLAPHLLDQTLCLFGLPQSIFVTLQTQRPSASTTDWFNALLTYPNRIAILEASMLAADPACRMLLRGSKGALFKQFGDRQETMLLEKTPLSDPLWGVDPDPMLYFSKEEKTPQRLTPLPGHYQAYYANIAAAINTTTSPVVSADQASSLMVLLEAGLLSAQNGKAVTPSYTPDEQKTWHPLLK